MCARIVPASKGTTEEKEQQVGDLMMIMMMLSEIGSSLCPRCPLDGFVWRASLRTALLRWPLEFTAKLFSSAELQ